MKKNIDSTFIYPYSEKFEIKRQQIWSNLQKGILFEENQTFIPWSLSYSDLDKYSNKREESGDRTRWYLGEKTIFDGYKSYFGVMKWIFIKDYEPFSEIEDFLGFDYEGNDKFIELRDRITKLLGEPTLVELEKFGNFDLGEIEWKNGIVKIRLVGIEQFACKYWLKIGLINSKIVLNKGYS